ncbi:MAG: ABC transporter ATP-binding protein/permease [Proteobacteria bacterium]|nr:ABC transporter ATP-binding protein/permease [Pseudomonadota bacterium]
MNLIEGIGLGLLIPVFQKLIGASDASSRFIEWFDRMFFYIHLKPTFLNTLILLCVVFLIRCAVSLWGRHISTKISSDFQFEIKQKTYKKLLDARLDFFWAHRQGDLMNILTTEANRASSAFFQTAQWVSTLLSVFIYIGLAIFISGWLALVAVIVAIAVLSPLTLIARKARKYGDLTTELNEEIQHELLNVLGAIKVLKGASNEKDALRRFKVQNKLFRDVWYKIAFSANSINIYSQPIAVIILSFFIYAGVKLNVGTVEIMVFLLVLLRLIPTIAALQGLQHNVNSNMPGYERITSLLRELDNAGERQGGLKVNPLERKIEFKGISFEYTEGKRILNELSLSIPANKTTSIVGPSGAGKSTLVDLILGFYTPQKGKIRIDDQNLEASDLNSWRNQIGYVSQEVVLFNDSIKANISWGDENISDEEIVAAAKMAAAHEFILELKNGYDTVIGDRGVKISGGQRQRLALARALVKKPKILILDEATSSLDHHSELDIKRSIEVMNRSKQITIIIIAHRFTTVQESDQIFVLDQGRIVEQGNWEQLTSNQGGYVAQINSGKEEIN